MKNADRVRYNSELLHISRCEVKDAEGSNGRSVVDPQLPRDDNAKNGRWSDGAVRLFAAPLQWRGTKPF